MKKITDRETWLDYLRSFITVLVVAHHSSLAYTSFAHFNKDAYILSTHPIVDPRRWKGLDFFEDFNDIFFMSLMFLISGIFIIRSVEKKGIPAFVRDRWKRLCVPFVIGVTILMPIAYYPAWLLAHGGFGGGGNGGVTSQLSGIGIFAASDGMSGWNEVSAQGGFPGWGHLKIYLVDFFTVEGWPVGPPWFIWVLLLFNVLFAALYPLIREPLRRLAGFVAAQKDDPVKLGLLWLAVTCLAYIPFALWLGADSWTGWGPFDFQRSRVVLYACYFMLGVLIGLPGVQNGILSGKALFVRTGSFWLVGSLSVYVLLKANEGPLAEVVSQHLWTGSFASLMYRSIWSVCCAFSCMAALTVFKERVGKSSARWDSLSANAYGIYLTHYIFVVWCQYELLNCPWPAIVKFGITFVVSLAMSWLVTDAVRKKSWVRNYL